MPKKKKPERKIEDMLLAELPNFGPGTSSNKTTGSLTTKDLQSAVEQLKKANARDPFDDLVKFQQHRYQQQMQQQALNNNYRNQLNNLQNQLHQRGVGQSQMASNLMWGISPLGSPTPRRPQQPMTPPKFLQGYKVTVRTGKTVWTVHHWEESTDPYAGRHIRLYFLEDEKGRQTREEEDDLRIFESEGISKKAQVDFDTVVISDEKREQILQALEQIHQADLIFNKWGFGDTIEKGKGVSMLFYGPPGTGKTLMAQAIANKLGYTLKVISTADIESSAPGEAERNIRKHFKEAKDGKSILLFDECDSLIFNRAGTGPILSAQINELLSQIERFDGITLFTTNRLGTLDEAVNRRLALKLEFDMPSQNERAEIWKRMFPVQAPLANDVDFKRLAIVELTGGYIKNAVLRAARMAAIEKLDDKDKKISMAHLIKALKLEAASMIEFEQAREDHLAPQGHVGMGQGNTEVKRKMGTIERVMGGNSNVR